MSLAAQTAHVCNNLFLLPFLYIVIREPFFQEARHCNYLAKKRGPAMCPMTKPTHLCVCFPNMGRVRMFYVWKVESAQAHRCMHAGLIPGLHSWMSLKSWKEGWRYGNLSVGS